MTVSTASPIILNGASLQALPDGALFWPDRGVLVVADLHLEKGSAFALTGQMLPPYDSRETLRLLAVAIAQWRPRQVICLGDSFHDPAAANRLAADDRQTLTDLIGQTDWLWISGNHDPAPPPELGGTSRAECVIGPLVFRHEAEPGPRFGEISGHFHPKASVQTRARRLSSRCFVEDGQRLILPAYGSYTGGLSVHDKAISSLFPKGFSAHLATPRGVLRIPRARLLKAA